MALSSTEAEFHAISYVVSEVTWMRSLLAELHVICKPLDVYCDNQNATY